MQIQECGCGEADVVRVGGGSAGGVGKLRGGASVAGAWSLVPWGAVVLGQGKGLHAAGEVVVGAWEPLRGRRSSLLQHQAGR